MGNVRPFLRGSESEEQSRAEQTSGRLELIHISFHSSCFRIFPRAVLSLSTSAAESGSGGQKLEMVKSAGQVRSEGSDSGSGSGSVSGSGSGSHGYGCLSFRLSAPVASLSSPVQRQQWSHAVNVVNVCKGVTV